LPQNRPPHCRPKICWRSSPRAQSANPDARSDPYLPQRRNPPRPVRSNGLAGAHLSCLSSGGFGRGGSVNQRHNDAAAGTSPWVDARYGRGSAAAASSPSEGCRRAGQVRGEGHGDAGESHRRDGGVGGSDGAPNNRAVPPRTASGDRGALADDEDAANRGTARRHPIAAARRSGPAVSAAASSGTRASIKATRLARQSVDVVRNRARR
jgi:hypothetical protein